jgi:hypothetical protein
MSTTCHRNREEDIKRVQSLMGVLNTHMVADYNLPKSIFVTYPGIIPSEADRKEITRLGWTIHYDMHTNKTTLKTEHARFTDFMFVWTFILVLLMTGIVYHGVFALYFFWQKNHIVEFI